MQNDQDDAAADIDPLASMKSPSDFAGQQLFIQGEDWHNNAMLGWTHFPWDIYAAGYKDAADALVGALAERKASLDSVVYPLVFLYRQGLELQLKLILPLARRLAGKEAVADHQHGLMPLWNELRRHLQQLDPREDDKELGRVNTAGAHTVFAARLRRWRSPQNSSLASSTACPSSAATSA